MKPPQHDLLLNTRCMVGSYLRLACLCCSNKTLLLNIFRRRNDHTEVNLISDGVKPRRSNHPLGMVGVGHFLKAHER